VLGRLKEEVRGVTGRIREEVGEVTGRIREEVVEVRGRLLSQTDTEEEMDEAAEAEAEAAELQVAALKESQELLVCEYLRHPWKCIGV
jgi:hypothetical protein